MPSLSERSLESIAKMFVGDEGELFRYLSGPQIVTFFNDHFDFRDTTKAATLLPDGDTLLER